MLIGNCQPRPRGRVSHRLFFQADAILPDLNLTRFIQAPDGPFELFLAQGEGRPDFIGGAFVVAGNESPGLLQFFNNYPAGKGNRSTLRRPAFPEAAGN